MAYNVSSYDTTRMSFGPGILYLGVPGTTPLTDVGAIKGKAELNIERGKLEVKQGSPQTLIAEYVMAESISLKLTGIEWNFNNLAYALGAGVTAGTGSYQETFEFGGNMAMTNRALRFVHRTPDGGTVDIQIFKAEGSGKVNIGFNDSDMHEFPYEFQALEGTSDFSNAALAVNKKLIKIIKTKV